MLYRACEDAGVVHMCGFPLRFLPPLRMARDLLADGALGDIWHVRGHYLRSVSAAEDDDAAGVTGRDRPRARRRVPLSLRSHRRHLCGRPPLRRRCPGRTRRSAPSSEFSSGAIGTFHIGRVASKQDRFALAIAGSRGTIAFDAEQLGELQVDTNGEGLRTIAATAGAHEASRGRFPDDHIVTARDAQALELAHMLTAIGERRSISPIGATFLDGYHATKLWERLTAAASSRSPERLPLLDLVLVDESADGGIAPLAAGARRT